MNLRKASAFNRADPLASAAVITNNNNRIQRNTLLSSEITSNRARIMKMSFMQAELWHRARLKSVIAASATKEPIIISQMRCGLAIKRFRPAAMASARVGVFTLAESWSEEEDLEPGNLKGARGFVRESLFLGGM